MSEVIKISASKLDTFESCSWTYWCKYHLKVPDVGNVGSKKGNVCHHVFELLLATNKNRENYINQIRKDRTCKNIKSLWRYIKWDAKREDIPAEEHTQHIDEMIYAGVKEVDFLLDKSQYDVTLEERFEFPIHENIYIVGAIDHKSINKKTGDILIRDYKSSKEKFAPKKIRNNFQGMMYALYIYRKTGIIPDVCFWFLQYPHNIKQMMPKVTKVELEGFEAYLKYSIASQMEQFDFNLARLGYAKDKPRPSKDEGFIGCLKCGFAKHKGQLKKDGSKMWHCDFKFDFDYYVIRDENGDVKHKSQYKKDLLKVAKNEKEIEKIHYSGCPAHK